MKLSDKQIAEIAEDLDCGMVCYFHRPTGIIESHPDPKDPYYDPEPWQDVIDKIESEWDNYDRFEKMNSTEGFRVMEDFAFSLKDINFRTKLLERLAGRKPFRNFMALIDPSIYRQDWFDFKRKAYIEFVKRQIVND